MHCATRRNLCCYITNVGTTTYHGMESENPYTHIQDFQVLCCTIKDGTTSNETIWLTLFPINLKDRAKTWLENLTPLSINTWAKLQALFLKNFFLADKTISLKKQISNFTAREGERFHQC